LKILADKDAVDSRELLACISVEAGDISLLRAQLVSNRDITSVLIPTKDHCDSLDTSYHTEHPLQRTTERDNARCDICRISGVSAFYCKTCDFDICLQCLDKNNDDYRQKSTLLHLVCRHNQPDLLLLLIEYGADINLCLSGNISAPRIAYCNGYTDCLKILADKDAIDSRELLAHAACKSNDIGLLRVQLDHNATVVNAIDPVSGDALVHVACRSNRPEILSLLLREYGADANVMTRDGKSAARIAYCNGYADCLKILADKDAIDSRELLAHAACKSNDIGLLRAQLDHDATVVNASDPVSGDALVHVACRSNRPEILSLLVREYGADANVMSRDGKSAARIAYCNGYTD
jgi:ankyrin repeat protein